MAYESHQRVLGTLNSRLLRMLAASYLYTCRLRSLTAVQWTCCQLDDSPQTL